MPNTTYSPSVLLIDDDKPFLEYLRENFHNKTTTGVLVASDLASARQLIDRTDISIDAVVSDLYFDEGRDDPAAGLSDGIDILAYSSRRRPQASRYIMSYFADRREYVGKLASHRVKVEGNFAKRLFQSEEEHQTPWTVIERDLIKQRLVADPALSKLTDEAVTEFARQVQWPVHTFLQDLVLRERIHGHPRFVLAREVRVLCTKEEDEGGNVLVTANAFDLGLLAAGTGANIEEALDSLKALILEQREQLHGPEPENLRGYAQLVKKRLDEIVIPDAADE